MTHLTIIACAALLLLGGLLFATLRAYVRSQHEWADRFAARTLNELTGHEMATERPKPIPKPKDPNRPLPQPRVAPHEQLSPAEYSDLCASGQAETRELGIG